jgi:hypothetical protein
VDPRRLRLRDRRDRDLAAAAEHVLGDDPGHGAVRPRPAGDQCPLPSLPLDAPDVPRHCLTADTPTEIHDRAAQINQLAVQSTAMPLGNATRMTQAERTLLGRWIRAGAKIQP